MSWEEREGCEKKGRVSKGGGKVQEADTILVNNA